MRLGRRKAKTDNQPRRGSTQNASPTVFSYYARGSATNNQNVGRLLDPSAPKRRHQPTLGHLPSYIALLAIIVAVLYSFWLQPKPNVVLIAQAGTVHRDPKTYQNAVEAIWQQSILNQTKLTVHSATIRDDIRNQFSELAEVNINLPLLGRRPTVVLTPATPALQLISVNGSFYVDASGKVMARITDVTQDEVKPLPLIRDESGLAAEPGKSVVPPSQATFLQELFAQLRAANVNVESITLPANAANEADVRVAGQGYYVKFSTDSDPRQATGTYLAAKAKLTTQPSEYMDVRVEEKVFYK